jgi:septum site-determining protein MinC
MEGVPSQAKNPAQPATPDPLAKSLQPDLPAQTKVSPTTMTPPLTAPLGSHLSFSLSATARPNPETRTEQQLQENRPQENRPPDAKPLGDTAAQPPLAAQASPSSPSDPTAKPAQTDPSPGLSASVGTSASADSPGGESAPPVAKFPELAVTDVQALSQATSPPTAKTDGAEPPVDPRQMVIWQNEQGKINLHLPAEISGGLTLHELWLQVQLRLNAGERFWQPHTPVELHAGRRLLDQRQLQTLAELLSQAQLSLKRIRTLRRQTAIAAATAGYAVEQEPTVAPLALGGPSSTLPCADPLYLETTLRSGTEIAHPGSVIVVGDLNPGSSIVADGDILVWGRLRGIVHAGARGNQRCRIMALQMEATQLRIGEHIARTPKPPAEYYPEVAYVTPEGIRLARANLKKID